MWGVLNILSIILVCAFVSGTSHCDADPNAHRLLFGVMLLLPPECIFAVPYWQPYLWRSSSLLVSHWLCGHRSWLLKFSLEAAFHHLLYCVTESERTDSAPHQSMHEFLILLAKELEPIMLRCMHSIFRSDEPEPHHHSFMVIHCVRALINPGIG